jgi:hypothetical protein
MAKKYLLYGGLLVLSVLSYESCGNNSTGPDSHLEFAEFSTNNPVSLLDFIGMDLNDLESYFLVDWTLAVDFAGGTKSPLRRLFARGFAPNQSATGFQARGLDMGTVSLTRVTDDSTQFSLDLSGNFSPAAGFIYRSISSPSPGSPRFIPGDSLRFNRSGSGDFAALSIDLTAPADSICVSESSASITLDRDEELRVAWRGGASTDRILRTMQPMIEFSNGRGFLSGIHDFFDNNAREFILSPPQLQQFLEHAAEELNTR